jgi:hypothetical protein
MRGARPSPTFLGHRLWEETRIAVFKQSVDDRGSFEPRRRLARTALGTGWLRGGPLELFTESVRLHRPLLPVLGNLGRPADRADWEAPPLDELRLHQGTVWHWNRAIYDPASGGHLRIEMRALPAGPTVIDMLANAAFLIGLSLWLAGQDQRWTYALSFERADHGFYRAAQQGLSARLSWPAGHHDQIRTLVAAKLVAELVPAARQGLLQAGVAAAAADGLLEVISARAASGQTGAVWQRAALAAARRHHDAERALAVMLDRYLQCAETGLPVHTWPAVSKPERAATAGPPRPGIHKHSHLRLRTTRRENSHGWQDAARGLGGKARENAVTAQCPESLTMCQVSRMYALPGGVVYVAPVLVFSTTTLLPSSQVVSVAVPFVIPLTCVEKNRSVPAGTRWRARPAVTAAMRLVSAWPVAYSLMGAARRQVSSDLVHRICDSRNPSITLACAGLAGSGVANTRV